MKLLLISNISVDNKIGKKIQWSFGYKSIARTIHIEIKFKCRRTNGIINGLALDKTYVQIFVKQKKKKKIRLRKTILSKYYTCDDYIR